MPNIPAIIYFGCAGVAIGSLGLALQVPSYLPKRHAVPQVETASASQPRVISTARPQNEAKDAEKAWPPTNGAVSFHDEMTALLNFESSTAVKSAHEDYAKALPAEQPPAAELPQETARAPAPEKRRKTSRRHRQRYNDDNTAEVVIREGDSYRSARVPRERDERAEYRIAPPLRDRGGYPPVESRGGFFGRW